MAVRKARKVKVPTVKKPKVVKIPKKGPAPKTRPGDPMGPQIN